MTNEATPGNVPLSDQLGPMPRKTVHEDDVWRIEYHTDSAMETERQRCYALGVAAERGRLASKFMAMAKEAHDAGHYSKRDELSAAAGWVLKA